MWRSCCYGGMLREFLERKYLDGFEALNPSAPSCSYIDYTLTSSDYKKIAPV